MKEDKLVSDFINYLHSKTFFYFILSSLFLLLSLGMVLDFNYSLTLLLQKDVLLNNFVTNYYYCFFCLILFFLYFYYSIMYIYHEDYISKFFIILSSAIGAYFLFCYFFMYGADNQVPEITELLVINQEPDITALLAANKIPEVVALLASDNVSYTGSVVSDSKYVVIRAFTILLVYVLVMFYFLRNTISIISELLIDYMDPEHDMVMKLFKMFIYTLIFVCIPYAFSDVIIL